MKAYSAYIVSISLVVALGFGFSSCKEDEPTRPKLSFAEPSMSVAENAGVIEVELVLDKSYGKDLTIEYNLGGTASDQDDVGSATADYEVVGDHGVVVIESGQTSGVIELEILNDVMFEADETIEISILDINTGDVELTADDETEITITNDDSQLIASFATTTMTANESDAVDANGDAILLEIPVQLDKTAPSDVTVEYNIIIDLEDETRSDAIDSTFGFENDIDPYYYDYYVEGTTGELVIPAGSSTANIEIQLFTDFLFEPDETIEITLTSTSVVEAGTNKTIKINLEQQDGKVIALVWDDYTDVDMDMFLWVGADTSNLTNILALAANGRTTPRQELIFIPSLFTQGAFGLSYVYYSGTADPMNFEVHFADFTAGVVEDVANRDIFAASYGLVNVNPFDETDIDPKIVHRFVIAAGAYSYGKIQVPDSRSRMKTSRSKLSPGLRKSSNSPPRLLF